MCVSVRGPVCPPCAHLDVCILEAQPVLHVSNKDGETLQFYISAESYTREVNYIDTNIQIISLNENSRME